MPGKPTNEKSLAASSSGTATPVIAKDTSESLATFAGGKPDKKAYEAEQAKIKTEIDTLQAQMTTVRDKIGFATKSGPGNDRRNALRAELDSIRDQQSTNKHARGKLLDQIKAIQDGIQKKTKDLQASKSKIPFKSVAEINAHVENLENQVESGNMKLVDEKRALQEISSCKRSRRTVEGFEAENNFIEAERQRIAELRAELDDPASKQVSERYDSIKAELDELKKESDEAYADRSKLFEERDDIQNQLQAAFNKKRQSSQLFREANDRYWTKVNDDRARRAEKARAQRAAEESQKKEEIAERLREEAQLPAFQAQIEDCQTLIDYFLGKSTGNITYKSTPLSVRPEVAGVPKLELRKVEETPEGLVVQKKKGDEEDAYFVSNKKNKSKKGSSKANGNGTGTTTPTTPTNANTSVNVPLATLAALMSLSIPPPASNLDIPRLIADLHTKKVWFEANQARVTAENVAKAEADIQRLTNHKGDPSSKPAVGEVDDVVDVQTVESVPVVDKETQAEEVAI